MHRLTSLRLATLLLALLVIAACNSDDDDDAATSATNQPTSTPAGTRAPDPSLADPSLADLASDPYLQGVADVSALFNDSNQQIDQTLSQTWPVRSRLIETLLAADRPGLASQMLEQLNALEPPAAYASDHASLVEVLEASVELARQEEAALQDGDLVTAVLLLADLRLLQGQVLFPSVSPAFCRALSEFDPDDSNGCDAGAGLEEQHGPYGPALFDAFDRYVREFGPRVGVFYDALSPEERFASLRILQPQIITAMDNAIAEIEALQPPADLAADHERLLQYFAEIRQTALDINAAVQAGDTPLLLQHFGASGVVTCNAANDLTDAIDPLVGFFFARSCDG